MELPGGGAEVVLPGFAEELRVVDPEKEVFSGLGVDLAAVLIENDDAVEALLCVGCFTVVDMKMIAIEVGSHGEVAPGIAIFAGINGIQLVGISGEDDIEAVGLGLKADDFRFGSLLWNVLGLKGSKTESCEDEEFF